MSAHFAPPTSVGQASFVDEMSEAWGTGSAHAFLVGGNTRDRVTVDEYSGLPADVLCERFSQRFDVVARYDLGGGLRAISGASQLRAAAGRADVGEASAAGPAEALRVIHTLLLGEPGLKVAVVIEAVDDLAPPGSPLTTMERACVQLLERIADDPRIAALQHVVVAVSADAEGVVSRLGDRASRWMRITIPFPQAAARESIIAEHVARGRPRLVGLDTASAARLTEGLTAVELERFLLGHSLIDADAVARARREALERGSGGLLLPVDPLPGGWGAVAGQEHVKRALDAMILDNGAFDPYQEGGVLLAGPPGTGKTMLARALAAEKPVIVLTLGDVRGSYVGQSERNLSVALELLRTYAPVVCFVDEFDQMIGRRGEGVEGDGGVERRLFGRLLAFMEETRRNGSVLWVGATNRPDLIDAALIQRMPRVLPVLPSGPQARAATMATIAASLGASAEHVDWSLAAARLQNAGGRDIEQIVRRAAKAGGGRITQEAIEHQTRDWVPPVNVAQIADWSRAALDHARFASDRPSPEDLPELLQGESLW